MKTGVQVLVYNQEEYLEYFLKSIYDYVDVIQIMYSERPFTKYNIYSRSQFFRVDTSLNILMNFPDSEKKIYIVKGIWEDEESMRNHAVDLLRIREVRLCLVFDADEFWPDNMLSSFIKHLKEHLKESEVAWCHYKTLFKRFDRVIDFPKSKLPVAFRISNDSRFIDRRVPMGKKLRIQDEYYYWHLGYILPDQRMFEKINTFSHANEVPDNWYKDKWLNFSSETKNLCRKGSNKWYQTIYNDPWNVPSILYEHPFFPHGPIESHLE